ncbi:MAG: MATE family efflux transporter, partial [Bryobacteraceae bacterium]
MGIVDTMMVGRVSAAAVGAVSIGGTLFYTIALLGVGIVLGLDTLISQSYGAGDLEDCHRSLINALYLILPLVPILMAAVLAWVPLLGWFGINPEVLRETIPYLKALAWSIPPLLLYFVLRRYLQGMNLVHPVMFALVSANLVNAVCDWAFIYGHLGARAMGAEGAGWATCLARVYMALVLVGYVIWFEMRHRIGLFAASLRFDAARVRRLLALGVPAALQIVLEVGVFAAATTLAGRLEPAALAAHQIAMNVVSTTFVVALGLGAAAAVRVGQALGRGDAEAASHAGWAAIALGAAFMTSTACAMLAVPALIVRAYTNEPDVIRIGATLLAVGAAFQIFDGLQGVATGALRGAGDTRTPMFCHLVGYWAIGLPLGYYLCFHLGWGITGLWIGLCVALILIGSVLVPAWRRTIAGEIARLAPKPNALANSKLADA